MRAPLLACLCFAVAGCGHAAGPAAMPPPLDADYPPGPYGVVAGSVIADLVFAGKSATTAQGYAALPLVPLSLGSLRGGGTRFIVVESGARWCSNCNSDQPAVRQLEHDYASKGVVVLDVLIEGGLGVPATELDISRWAETHQLSGPIAIDAQLVLAPYVASYPTYFVLRAATMQIERISVAPLAAAPLGPLLDELLAH